MSLREKMIDEVARIFEFDYQARIATENACISHLRIHFKRVFVFL